MKMLSYLRIRTGLLVGCGICFLIWIFIISYLNRTDQCNGKLYTSYICDQYSKGVVSGSLCNDLCNTKSVVLDRCIREEDNHGVFLYGKKEIKVNLQPVISYLMHDEKGTLSSGGIYRHPAKGSSMTDFRKMVVSFVDSKLGPGEHTDLVKTIMDIADVNKDAKVSLAEAKTIWALLQRNEFFINLAFKSCDHFPQIREFCGDAYVVEPVVHRYLYKASSHPWISWFIPSYDKWGLPSWHNRAKIMVGLLEFTLEAFQSSSGTSFYFCDLNERNIGYNSKFDMKIINPSRIISKKKKVPTATLR